MDPLSESTVVDYGSIQGDRLKDEEESHLTEEEGTSQENLSEDNAKKEEEKNIRKNGSQEVLNEKCNRNMKNTLVDKSFLNKLFRTALADAAYLGVVSKSFLKFSSYCGFINFSMPSWGGRVVYSSVRATRTVAGSSPEPPPMPADTSAGM